MIQTITKEWEITQTYIFDVVMRDGLIKLDWDDFRNFAENHRPKIAVKVEEDLPISGLVECAMREIEKYCLGRLASFIVSISYKRDDEIMMDEINGLSESLASIADKDIEIKWGLSPNDNVRYRRSLCIFVFEK